MLMDVPPKDYDIATNALPEGVLALFPDSLAVGKAFGVMLVQQDGAQYEVATFRRDHGHADGRHPDAVTFTDAETDAQRRDFTINALFFDPVAGQLLDYVGGQADIAQRLVRTVGTPAERFAEDHLRLLRAARFAAVLEFAIDPDTAAAVRAGAGLLTRVSPERIRQELVRMLTEAPRPGDAIVLLRDLGLLPVILPEVAALEGQAQPPEFHPEGDVFVHTILMLNVMTTRDVRLALAVLLHDVGKPVTARLIDDRLRFYNHAGEGARMAEEIMRRLRFSNEDTDAVVHAVGTHMRVGDAQRMRRATLRRLLGDAHFPLELELHRLDCVASHREMDNYEFLVNASRELAGEPVLPDAWINGRDIMQLGVPQGPEIGRWLKTAYDAQLEGTFTDRQSLLAWLRRLIADNASPNVTPAE